MTIIGDVSETWFLVEIYCAEWLGWNISAIVLVEKASRRRKKSMVPMMSCKAMQHV